MKDDVIDKLIDAVHEYTFVDLPIVRSIEYDQPELGITNIKELRKTMIGILEAEYKKYLLNRKQEEDEYKKNLLNRK